MSFDLYFCSRERSFNASAFEAWANSSPFFKKHGTSQFWYENEHTGVYFSFDLVDSPDPEESQIPDGFIDTGLSFNINFSRPSFFALEAMPLVEQLQNELDLLVVNPQDWDDSSPQKFTADRLIENWSVTNKNAVVALHGQGVEPNIKIESTKALESWKYNHARGLFEDKATEASFVPHIVFMRQKGFSVAKSAFILTLGISTLVPETDWTVTFKSSKNFLGKEKKELRVFSTEKVKRQLKDLLTPASIKEKCNLDVKLLPQSKVLEAERLLKQIEADLDFSDVERLGTDRLDDTTVEA